VEVRYRVTCPFFQLKKQLEAMRDSLDWKKLGILLGRRGLCIAAFILGDRGGDSMKFQLSVLARDGDGQRYRNIIGTAEGLEDYHVLKNTCATVINEGIKLIMSHNVLVVEWEGGFDFIVVPAGSCPIEEDRCSL